MARSPRGQKPVADKVGATWIATLDYRIYAELRWHLKDSIPVVQVNERSRFIGFRDSASAAMKSGIGLYVDSAPNDGNVIETKTPATLKLVGQADRTWRGVVIEPRSRSRRLIRMDARAVTASDLAVLPMAIAQLTKNPGRAMRPGFSIQVRPGISSRRSRSASGCREACERGAAHSSQCRRHSRRSRSPG